MNAAMRVNKPTTISRPRTNSISPANQKGQVPVGTAVPSGQPNQLYRAVQHVEQSEDDPEDAQRRGGEACQTCVQVGSHRPDHTPRLAAFSQPDLMVTRPIRSRYRYERPDGANATRPFGRRGLHVGLQRELAAGSL